VQEQHSRPSRPTEEASPRRPQEPRPLEAFTQQWWSSWHQANALGWGYLNAASDMFRLNVDALARAARLMSPLEAASERRRAS
jgi:hypothetical protein